MSKKAAAAAVPVSNKTSWEIMKKKLWKNRTIYVMLIPIVVYYILFHYKPMYGLIISFMDYNPRRGIAGSNWVGLRNFTDFFGGYYFGRLMRNTLKISFASLIFGFPAPIILALLINELRSRTFSRVVQTVTYMPHFISMVVFCAMIREFMGSTGFITELMVKFFGYNGKDMLSVAGFWVPMYVLTDIWQGVGWGSIVYLAALTGIDTQLYDAARVDGANKWQQILNVTIPCLIPTVITMLIMRVGQIMGIGYEKTLLLYNDGILDTADIISTYVYRMGLVSRQYSFSAAVGLFNSVVNFALVVTANTISKRFSETSLW